MSSAHHVAVGEVDLEAVVHAVDEVGYLLQCGLVEMKSELLAANVADRGQTNATNDPSAPLAAIYLYRASTEGSAEICTLSIFARIQHREIW